MIPKLTKDLDSLFFPRLEEIAASLGAKPRDMLAVMYSESGVRATAKNPNHDANGLIQFMGPTLKGLGWTNGGEAFRKLSATEQLPFVRRYYARHVGHLGNIAGLYVATFLPALVKHAGTPDYVLVAKGGQLGWAYAPNAGFDRNGDYKITVRELEEAVVRNCRGARWAEIVARLEHGAIDPELVEYGFDLRTTAGLQRALDRLGFDLGPIDGLPGPLTRAAVEAFQREDGTLVVDGIYGPKTRAALEMTLKARA